MRGGKVKLRCEGVKDLLYWWCVGVGGPSRGGREEKALGVGDGGRGRRLLLLVCQS